MNTKDHFIKSFEIRNFRGIIDTGKVTFSDYARWVFLTGENGFGKTSVLQGIVSVLYGKFNVPIEKEEQDNIQSKVITHSRDFSQENYYDKNTNKGKLSDFEQILKQLFIRKEEKDRKGSFNLWSDAYKSRPFGSLA